MMLVNDKLFKPKGNPYTLDSFIGQSKSMIQVRKQALQTSRSSATVLIYGERGTGKEHLAQAIHNAGSRFTRPFVKVDCALLNAELGEVELFGCAAGTYSGYLMHGKAGKFELAEGGTIFLDEIDKMPWSLQGRVLRVIHEKELERVGGIKARNIDVRVIAATSQNLEQLTNKGLFRKELYYRLKVLDITIPPLRKHLQDIPLLVAYLLSIYNEKLGRHVCGVAEEVMAFLKSYHWPGNMRELENIIERAVACCHQDMIQTDALAVQIGEPGKQLSQLVFSETTKVLAREAQKKAIVHALAMTMGNKSRAAKLLGISRTALYYKLTEFG